MKAKTYAAVCGGLSLITVLAVLFIPGVSDAIEGLVIAFLSSNAG